MPSTRSLSLSDAQQSLILAFHVAATVTVFAFVTYLTLLH